MKENSSAIALVIPAAPGITLDVLSSAKNQSRPIEVIVEEGPNPSANRNRGAARATAPLVAFANAHTILQEDWAEKTEGFFRKHPEIDLIGGPQLNYPGDSYFARMSGDALASSFCTGDMSQRYKPGAINLDADESSLTSANLICRKKVFEKVQFDENLYPGEDPKFITDAKRAGFKLAYVPDVIVFNRRRKGWLALARQIYNYGASRVKKETLSELLRHPKFFAPAMLTVYLLLLPFLFVWNRYALIPLWIYLFAAIVAATKQAGSCRRIEYPIVLPPVFLWIHIAYGIGFLRQFLAGGFARK